MARDSTPNTAADPIVAGDCLDVLALLGSDPILELDGEGRIVYASPNVERLMGIEPAEFVGQMLQDIVFPGDRLNVVGGLKRLARGISPVTMLYRCGGHDGRATWHEGLATSIPVDPDRTRTLLVCRDVSRRQNEIERLQESEGRYRLLVEQAPEGIIVHTRGRILFANNAAATIIGAPDASSLIGTRIEDIVAPESREETRQQVDEARRGRVMRKREWRLLRRDGAIRDMEGTGGLATWDGKRAILGIMRDVTELKRSERERERLEVQLRQTQKLDSLGVMAGGIAHDFNNLLTVILGNARLALDVAGSDDDLAAILGDAIKAAESATNLTRQLLAYAGRTATEVRLVDLSEHVGSISELLIQARPKKVHLKLDLAQRLPVVMADTAQLQQVTMNLVLNAADAIGDDQGRVRVSTSVAQVDSETVAGWLGADSAMPGEYVTLQVSDTGTGMGEEIIDAIFDPFFSTKTTGHGLGLSAVLGMVKGHGGGVRVESKRGEGTTFTVYLPVAGNGVVQEALSGTLALDAGRGRVLVVDDEEGMRSYLRRLLERSGYEVSEACDGVEALEAIDEDAPDIVVLDLNMPRMSGEEVLARLHHSHEALPIVLSSGDDASELASRVASMSRVRFVGKPYTEDKMLGAIERLLG